MLKKTQFNTEARYEETVSLLLLATIILWLLFNYPGNNIIDIGNGYHTITTRFFLGVLFFIFIITLGYFKFKEELRLSRKVIYHNNLTDCYYLAFIHTKECEVVRIVKKNMEKEHNGIPYTTSFYVVYFDYKENDNIKRRGSVKVGLDEGEELLTSKYFCFILKDKGVQVKNLDIENYLRTHTRTRVRCEDGAVLRKGSKMGCEYIRDVDYYTERALGRI